MAKRVNGAGSVRKMSNGRYRWELTLGYRMVNGETKRDGVSGTARTKVEAETALANAITQRDRGTLALPDHVTVSKYAEMWLKRQEGLSTRSLAMYATELSYALEHIGKLKMRDVRPLQLKNMLDALKTRVMGKRDETGQPLEPNAPLMSTRTLGNVLTRLRAVFAEAVSDQIIYVNPCESVKKPKSPRAESVGVVLDFDQASRFQELGEALYVAGICQLWPALFTALAIGLRRSEVMGLRWQDVDLERGMISIRHTSVPQTKGFDLGERTKTGHSRRDIPMPPSLKAMLMSHQQKQKLERASVGDAWRDSGAVFTTNLGWWISPDNLNRALRNLLEWSDSKTLLERYEPNEPTRTTKKGADMTNLTRRLRTAPRPHHARLETIVRAGERLPEISPHDLRHTYATLALRRRVPPEVVSKTLGHARISITLDIYRHVLESELREHVFDVFATTLPAREIPSVPMN